MVAYSFKKQFAEPILAGTKRQTIRADRKRHARPGEEMQLYTGMRTKYCRLIGRVWCQSVRPISLCLDAPKAFIRWENGGAETIYPLGMDEFAKCDGFRDWQEMRKFWRDNHPDVDVFEGVIIRWTVR